MSELAVAVCSITPTSRRRYFWAAWWTSPPARDPFVKPDAANGGATSVEAALLAAQKAAGRALAQIEPRWARAWSRVLRELPPWTSRDAESFATGHAPPVRASHAAPESIWRTLGVAADASLDEIKKAYRRRALQAHPDHGGEAEHFMALKRAYEKATQRKDKAERRPKKRA